MRTVSTAMLNHLQGEVITMTICVRIERIDGVVLGFTTLDEDLIVSGEPYESISSISSTAVRQEIGSGIDNMDINGLLDSDRISETDLRAGIYDNAIIDIFQVNYNDLTASKVILIHGIIGQISVNEVNYTAEVRSFTQRLSQQIGRLVGKTCDVRQLGDERCAPGGHFADGHDITFYEVDHTIDNVISAHQLVINGDIHSSGYYAYGKITFLTGENAGLEREIRSHVHTFATATITLQEAFPFAIAIGDSVRMQKGCNRTTAGCAGFNNIVNYQGFPFVPGTDILMKQGRGATK